MSNTRVDVAAMQLALRLLVGPGFGHQGFSEGEVVKELVGRSGMTPTEAYLATKAAIMLARDKGIKIKR